jgi:hypothetical protein
MQEFDVGFWLSLRLLPDGIVPEDAVMNAQALPMVMMPARDSFVEDDLRGGDLPAA